MREEDQREILKGDTKPSWGRTTSERRSNSNVQ
jgi:hypothetical protein